MGDKSSWHTFAKKTRFDILPLILFYLHLALFLWYTRSPNSMLCLAYGWRAGNFNWPIGIQQARKNSLSAHVNVSWQERHWNQATFIIGDGMKYSRKGICNSQNHITLQKVKNMKHFVSPASNLAPKMVVPLASPSRIIVVLFSAKYAVHRQIKSEIL